MGGGEDHPQNKNQHLVAKESLILNPIFALSAYAKGPLEFNDTEIFHLLTASQIHEMEKY